MEDKIKNSELWSELSANPKFKTEFEKCLKKYSYYADPKDLNVKIIDNKLIVVYNSKIRNSDIGCQYKLFEQTEFFYDKNDNLIVNGLAGRFESEKGFKFKTTDGGYINTHYTCVVYDPDGIELSNSRYDDKYSFDKIEVNSFMRDFQSVILGAYNPDLGVYSNATGVCPYPKVVGNNSKFNRQSRSIDNLGLVEVIDCVFDNKSRIYNKAYYFNVLLSNQDIYTPELIHILSGEPFAILNENGDLCITDQYRDMCITKNNYKKVSQRRFLSELKQRKEEEEVYYVDDVYKKYEMLIDKIENDKVNVKKRTL